MIGLGRKAAATLLLGYFSFSFYARQWSLGRELGLNCRIDGVLEPIEQLTSTIENQIGASAFQLFPGSKTT